MDHVMSQPTDPDLDLEPIRAAVEQWRDPGPEGLTDAWFAHEAAYKYLPALLREVERLRGAFHAQRENYMRVVNALFPGTVVGWPDPVEEVERLRGERDDLTHRYESLRAACQQWELMHAEAQARAEAVEDMRNVWHQRYEVQKRAADFAELGARAAEQRVKELEATSADLCPHCGWRGIRATDPCAFCGGTVE